MGPAVAIASRLDSGKAIEITKDLIRFLMDQKIKVYPEMRIASLVKLPMLGRQLSEMTRDEIGAVISVGGDGTILRVAQNLSDRNPPPIIGVNVGAVGFLAEFDMPSTGNFSRLLETDYIEERCLRLSCELSSKGNKTRDIPYALNEILIITSRPSKALSVVIKIDGQRYSSGYVDGILVSTPVGSTAYSLSAGGCIMLPEMETIQIVPVCPFARTGLKAINIPATAVIEIELLRPKLSAIIAIDGQREIPCYPSQKITIKKSHSYIRFLRSENLNHSFFSRLNRKLLPGAKFPVPKHDSPEE